MTMIYTNYNKVLNKEQLIGYEPIGLNLSYFIRELKPFNLQLNIQYIITSHKDLELTLK